MRIFIAGASGVLGRRLVRECVARGHSVFGQVRSAKAEGTVREAGGQPRHADLFDAESLAKAAEGCDTMIHAATAIPVKQKTTPADWAMNDHIRRKGTRCLTEAAAKIGAKTYLQQSIAWVARAKNDSPFDEDSPTVPAPGIQSAIDAESIARDAESAEGFTVSILRGGFFYDSDSAHTRMIAAALRRRQMPIIGSGDAMWAMIHTDDAASAYVLAAENPKSGVWHIVDNELVAVRTFLEEFAARLGAPAPRRVPVWLAKWLAGEQAGEYFTRSTRTNNARFRRDFGWTPRYPTYREGLDQVVRAWNGDPARNQVA
ncbi:MAG TPA: NAD-dependent epimerase/dehydratase family protein [Candidatus Acidoferrales bacterium]|jgi:nucleoside-diphosphate-sugar epimerase|nr:NAD-dependent epimerase/dehydratase family protein [Candidatus Acidoferrales bacterium]